MYIHIVTRHLLRGGNQICVVLNQHVAVQTHMCWDVCNQLLQLNSSILNTERYNTRCPMAAIMRGGKSNMWAIGNRYQGALILNWISTTRDIDITHKHLGLTPVNIGFCHHCSKKWSGARSAPCHFLNQC